MNVVVILVWVAANLLLLLVLLHLRQKGKGGPLVSVTDKLTRSEEYSKNLEHYAQQLAEITEQLANCQRSYDEETDEAKRAELGSRIDLLKKKQDMARQKCSNLLRKLD